MHILIIPSEHFMTPKYKLGGIFQMHQAKALKDIGNQVGIISGGVLSPRYIFDRYTYTSKESIEGINILREYFSFFIPYRWLKFWIVKRLHIWQGIKLYKRYVREYGSPDIIHAHNFLYAGFIAEAIKKRYGIAYVLTEHSSAFAMKYIPSKYIIALQKCAKNSSGVSAVSSSFAKLLEKDIGISNISILPNIVEKSFFQDPECYKDEQNFVFLNVGSLDVNKNQQLLIKSFAKWFKNKNAILKIAGDGVLTDELRRLVRKLEIETQVEFLGLLTQKEIICEMNKAHCFVLPSKYETFGVVLIEALACGLPLIATRSGGPEDIVTEENGLLINVDNQRELEDAMLYMYEYFHIYDSQKLKEYAMNTFGEKAFVNNVINFYKKGKE